VERSELLDWEQRIKGLKEDVAKLNNSKNSLEISGAPPGVIKEIAEMVESIKIMKKGGRDIPEKNLLERIGLILDLALIYSGESLPNQIKHKNQEELEKLVLGEVLKPREELKPVNINLNYQKGIASLKKGEFNEAKKCFEKITKVNPNLKGAWLNRGYSAGILGDVRTEIDCYTMALKIDKDYKIAKYNLKIAEREMKRTR
jgi:tetratricopeptide (TPR) repeat protein